MTTTSVRPGGYKHSSRDPGTAALLSLIPGLGQLYNGETRKGFLFLSVAFMNLVLFVGMCGTKPILKAMYDFGVTFHMKPNAMLMRVVNEATIGSAVSFILIGFFISFVAYSVRDAYDHAALKRRKIYPDMVIELPEATSGSYICHFAFMAALFVLAFFFIVPLPPQAQITDIEFIQNQPPTMKKIISRRKAEKNSENAGKHEPKKPVQAPSPEPKAAAKQAAPAKQTPAPTPSPSPTPRPMPQPVSRPSPTPTPAPGPRMPSPSPSPMPRLSPTPMAMPSPSPTPRAMPMATPSPMPSLSPSPMAAPRGTGFAPTPVARPTGLPSGLPSSAPSPIAIASGGMPGFAPTPRAGSSAGAGAYSAPAPIAPAGGGGGGANGAPSPVPVAPAAGGGRGATGGGGGAPAPTRARSGGGGGGGGSGSGPALLVSPSVPRGGGGGGGDGNKGNPEANNNPGGRPSLAAQKDVDFGPYMADLQRRIKRHWFPPKGNESKRVVVTFKVHSGGEMSNLRLDRSSGVAIADKAALDAVQNAAPFRPLPDGAPSDVDIQFTFDYNVFTGGGSGTFRRF